MATAIAVLCVNPELVEELEGVDEDDDDVEIAPILLTVEVLLLATTNALELKPELVLVLEFEEELVLELEAVLEEALVVEDVAGSPIIATLVSVVEGSPVPDDKRPLVVVVPFNKANGGDAVVVSRVLVVDTL